MTAYFPVYVHVHLSMREKIHSESSKKINGSQSDPLIHVSIYRLCPVTELDNYRFAGFINRIYHIELEIKHTASYRDLHLIIDSDT